MLPSSSNSKDLNSSTSEHENCPKEPNDGLELNFDFFFDCKKKFLD